MKEKPNEKDPKQGLSKRDKFKAMLKGKKDGKKTEESDREARAHALVDMMLEDESDPEPEEGKKPEPEEKEETEPDEEKADDE